MSNGIAYQVSSSEKGIQGRKQRMLIFRILETRTGQRSGRKEKQELGY